MARTIAVCPGRRRNTLIQAFPWLPHQAGYPGFSCRLRTTKKQIHHPTPTLPGTPGFCCSAIATLATVSTTVLIPVSVPHYYNDTWRGHHPQGPVFLSLTSEGGPVGWGWLQSPFQALLLPSTQAAPSGSAEVLPPQPGYAGYSGAVPLTQMENNNLVRVARGAGSGHHSESKKRMCVVKSVHQSLLIWTGFTAHLQRL